MGININLKNIKWNSIDVITHNDLDGYSANVLMKIIEYFNPNISINIRNIGYKNSLSVALDNALENMYNTKSSENKLLIVNDLGFTRSEVNKIRCVLETESLKHSNIYVHAVLCDHHMQSIEFEQKPNSNDYIETFVVTENSKYSKKCGSRILYEYLITIGLIPSIEYCNIHDKAICTKISQYMEHVNNYDCWLWKEQDKFAERLNMYFSAIKNDDFVQSIYNILINEDTDNLPFNVALEKSNAGNIIRERERDIRNTELLMNQNVKISNFNNEYIIGAVICDRYISNVGNYICEKNPNIDFCMLLNPMSGYVSFRGTKDDINLARISNRLFGGNGHKLSAAARINNDTMLSLLQNHICI